MSVPPTLALLDREGQPRVFNTLPSVGKKRPEECLPVVLAGGVQLIQRAVILPTFDKAQFEKTCIRVCSANPDRRYLKIVNNGAAFVELWTSPPNPEYPARIDLPFGEVLPPRGGGIVETDTCRVNEIWATAREATILLVLEG